MMIVKAEKQLVDAVVDVSKKDSELFELIPPWMRVALCEGDVLFMESVDYAWLNTLVKDHLRVIKW